MIRQKLALLSLYSADGYRFNGKAVCHNGPVRGDQLEQVVWDQVRSLLEEPGRVADEYRRRIGQAQDGAAMPDEIVRLNHQLTTMRRGIGRLIDSYAEGVIDKAEFEPRIAGLNSGGRGRTRSEILYPACINAIDETDQVKFSVRASCVAGSIRICR